MQPYYEHAGITIYHGDCRDILPTLDKVDLVLTDPPYGIKDKPQGPSKKIHNARSGRARKNTWHPASDWDAMIDPKWCRLACEAADIVAWFGHWRKRIEVEAAMTHPLRAEIIWAKDTHVGPPCPLAMRGERIWIFAAQDIKGNCFETTIWNEPVIPTWKYKHHKNEKPESLMRRLVKWLPGQTILDPFIGSGTTLRAAKDLGHRAIGIELEEQYCEIAARRLAQEVLQFGEKEVL